MDYHATAVVIGSCEGGALVATAAEADAAAQLGAEAAGRGGANTGIDRVRGRRIVLTVDPFNIIKRIKANLGVSAPMNCTSLFYETTLH